MSEEKQDMNPLLSWIGTVLGFIKEHGALNIIKAFLLVVIISVLWDFRQNPDIFFEKYAQFVEERHKTELILRMEKDEKIKAILPRYLTKYKGNRVWIVNYHNGVMDWQHGTMRFELCYKANSIKTQYDNFNLTWLNLPFYLRDNEYFIGNIDELEEIDPILALQFSKNNTYCMACIVIKDTYSYPLGVLGVTWDKEPDNWDEIKVEVYKYLLEDRLELRSLLN